MRQTRTAAAVILVFCLALIMPAGAYTGSGTEDSPYLLSSAADLQQLAADVNAGNAYTGEFFQITNDITLTGEWTPIGNGSRSGSSYTSRPWGTDVERIKNWGLKRILILEVKTGKRK